MDWSNSIVTLNRYLTFLSYTSLAWVVPIFQRSPLLLLSSLILRDCRLQNNQLCLGSMNSLFLSRIQHLDLSWNNFDGPIPKAFHNMTSLKLQDLSTNEFTSIDGGLSSFVFGNNGILKALDLSYNYDLGGDVFESYENESMYELHSVWIASAQIRENISRNKNSRLVRKIQKLAVSFPV